MTWTRPQTQEAPATQSAFGAVVPEDSGVEDENEVVIELSATEDEAAQHTDGLSHDGEIEGDSMPEGYVQEDEQDEQTAEEDQDDDNDEDDQLTEDGNEEDDDEIAETDAASRKKRFESSLPNNRFLEVSRRRTFSAQSLMPMYSSSPCERRAGSRRSSRASSLTLQSQCDSTRLPTLREHARKCVPSGNGTSASIRTTSIRSRGCSRSW